MRGAKIKPIEWFYEEDEEEKEMPRNYNYSNMIRKARPSKGLTKRLKKYKILTNYSFEWSDQAKP